MPNIGENAFWQFDENRAKLGYKSAWLVKHPASWNTAGKYSLIGLTSSVPYPFGDAETFDVNVLQSPVIGQLRGKTSMESTDVSVYHHRDNAYRFNELAKHDVLEFMSINSEYMGYKFTGSLEYRPDSAEASEHMATVTITPLSGDKTPVYDARNEIIETVCLANPIPAKSTTGVPIDFAIKQSGATPTFKVKKITAGTNAETDMVAQTNYTLSGSKITFSTDGLMVIEVSAEGYAPWTTTVYVEQATSAQPT